MTETPLRGIVFDKDGTLFDFARTWEAWAAAFLRSIAPDPDAALHLGAQIGFDMATRTFAPDSIVIAASSAEIAAQLAPHVPQMTEAALLDTLNREAARAPQAETVPLGPFLSGLRAAGYRLGVATNDAEAPARAHLKAAGVTDLFDFIAGYDSGHGLKPGPGMLLAFAKATGLDPAEIAMIGDSVGDLRVGPAAGAALSIGVLTGPATAEDLAGDADHILPSIAELPALLAKLP